jgi:hypothetical protein
MKKRYDRSAIIPSAFTAFLSRWNREGNFLPSIREGRNIKKIYEILLSCLLKKCYAFMLELKSKAGNIYDSNLVPCFI